MTTGEGNGENGNGMLFFDACAIAKRTIHETTAINEQNFALRGQSEQFEPLPDGLADVLALGQAHMIVDVIQGNEPKSVREYIAGTIQNLSDESLVEIFHDEVEPEEDLDPEHLRDFFGDLMANTFAFTGQTQIEADEIRKIYGAAIKLSEQNGLSVEELFTSDEQYSELVRMTNEPTEFCRKGLDGAHKITPRSISDLMHSNSLAMLRLEAASEYTEVSPEDLEEVEEQMGTFEFKDKVVEEFYTTRKILATQLISRLQRFWGQEVLASLPDDLRQTLEQMASHTAPKPQQQIGRTLVNKFLSGAFPANYRENRTTFVRRYCRENNLEPDELSVEQIIMIHGLQDNTSNSPN